MKRQFVLALIVAAPAGAQVTATISVNAAEVVRIFDDRIAGMNTLIFDPNMAAPGDTTPFIPPLDVRAMRFPGGSLSDTYNWRTDTTIDSSGNPQPWQQWDGTSYQAFEALAQAVSASSMLTANYGDGTPALAAAWVQDSLTEGFNVKYWEIGNEVFGSWEYDANTPPHDPVEYATRAQQYLAQMKAVDPTLRVGLVVAGDEDSYPSSHAVTNPVTGATHSGWDAVMLATLAKLGVAPDYVIYHRYEQQPGQESDSFLLQAAAGWPATAASLRAELNDYLGPAGAAVELLCTENNSVSSLPGRQSVSLVNGLYLADSFGYLCQTEFNGLYWFTLRYITETDGNLSASLYGWRDYGDYGLMAQAAPQSLDFGLVAEPEYFPTYFIASMLAQFARQGDEIVSATSNAAALLSVFAARRADGSLSLLVLNKSPAETITGQFTLDGFIPAAAATQYQYGVPQDNQAETDASNGDTLGIDPAAGVQTSTVPIAGAAFTMSFAPYSATLLSIPPAQVPSGTARLVNLSALGWVEGSVHLLDSGLVIAGSGSEQVLIRAVGPSLTAFSVASALPDPVLTVFDSAGQPIASNAGWGGSATLANAFASVSAFSLPPESLDSALILTLPPGQYTAEVTSRSGATGNALVEVYELPAATPTARLHNLSSRGYADSGAHELTGGFVIGGSGPEAVIVRAVGPTLANFGLTSYVADPALRVLSGSTVISACDDWGGSPSLAADFAAVGAFSLPPLSRDAAVKVTLPQGNYTTQAFATNGPAGDVLVEVYER